ncbi:YeeE/YedE thiosulfate transporter family protein [Bacteroidota bacterium]
MARRKPYMNPYLAGVFLGMVLLSAMYLSGRGLGASGGIKYCVVSIVGAGSQDHVQNSPYYSKYFAGDSSPLKNWLVLEILGMLLGGFISGAISGRITWRVERSPNISSRKRLLMAFLGGVLFVYGAQLARGCTSGAALSGMAVLTSAGFVTMIAIFGSGYLFAWFFRKNWI